DPGGAIANDPVELFLEIFHDAVDAIGGQVILIARLGGRQQIQCLKALVADQSLRKLCVTLNDINQIEHDAAVSPHDEVKVTQTNIEVDNDCLLAALRQRGADCSG